MNNYGIEAAENRKLFASKKLPNTDLIELNPALLCCGITVAEETVKKAAEIEHKGSFYLKSQFFKEKEWTFHRK